MEFSDIVSFSAVISKQLSGQAYPMIGPTAIQLAFLLSIFQLKKYVETIGGFVDTLLRAQILSSLLLIV